MATNVPNVEFTPTGLTVPQESAVLAGAQADIDAAFGGGVNPALETPQGQLASSLTAIVSNSQAVFAEFVNQVNPDTADGFMQDAIARINFINRQAATSTVVSCVCSGATGTPIPIGAQAKDTSGNIYAALDSGVIPVGGSITLSFANTQTGPIPCPSNTLTAINRSVPGWDTVNNPSAGVLGSNVESQAAFAYRRAQSVAINGKGSLPSIYAAVFDLPDVLDVYAYENFTNSSQNVGSTAYAVLPHSIYVAVVGGDDTAIGQAIFSRKDVGCDMNGNTSVVITDTSYQPPQPTYTYKFNRPSPLAIKFAVQLAASASLPANIADLVKAAIIAAFNGTNGTLRVRIASLILASRFYGPVQAIGDEVSILSILIGTVTATLTSIQAGIDQAPSVSPTDISVALI